jgi:hypothetical protein
MILSGVMPGQIHPKDGVASLAYVPGIPVCGSIGIKDGKGRDKPSHHKFAE